MKGASRKTSDGNTRRSDSRAGAALLGLTTHDGATLASARRARHPPWVMAAGSLEAIKWTALVLMAFDHANKYLYAEKLPIVFQLGRVVMPMFGFVLAYNLARPDALVKGLHARMIYRLGATGLIAAPICVMLNSQFVNASLWWPLNILFTLLLVVALTYLIDRGGAKRYALAIALFVLA